jgi:lipopolysaccharide biosynthesis protein
MLVGIIKRLLRYARKAVALALMHLSAFRASFRTRSNYVKESLPGEVELEGQGKVVVFAHFDPHGRVHRFVMHQLRQLQALGYATVFVTNSGKLDPVSLGELKPLVAKILLRENVGYDFGAYKDGIAALGDLGALEQLILANDSVYGPFRDLSGVIENLQADPGDAVAVTDSWEVRYHLQSYFLCFKRNVLSSPEFQQFWRGLKYVDNKHYVVRHYEVGLSQLLLRLQFNCRALYPYEQAAKLFHDKLMAMDLASEEFKAMPERNQDYYQSLRHNIDMGVPINGSHFLWEVLLTEMGCPYIKRELLSKNPMKVPGLMRLDALIANQGDYDVSMIRDHLKQVNFDRAY